MREYLGQCRCQLLNNNVLISMWRGKAMRSAKFHFSLNLLLYSQYCVYLLYAHWKCNSKKYYYYKHWDSAYLRQGMSYQCRHLANQYEQQIYIC